MDLNIIPAGQCVVGFVSANGIIHYQVTTFNPMFNEGPKITHIQRPASPYECPGENIIAEVDWKWNGFPTVIRSTFFDRQGREMFNSCVGTRGVGVKASKVLRRKSRFSSARCFTGDDGFQYLWKNVKGPGSSTLTLINSTTDVEIASHLRITASEGIFAGERKQVLRIHPCSLDIDLIILTFILIQTKAWDREGSRQHGDHTIEEDQDSPGDAGGSGGEDGAAEAGDEADLGATGEV